MGRRRGADVRIQDIQIRKNKRSKYIVRWVVQGKECSEAYPLKKSADALRARLIRAVEDREVFSTTTGYPKSWDTTTVTVAEWAKQWVQEQLPTWEPRSRRSAIESVVRLLEVTTSKKAPAVPAEFRREAAEWLAGLKDKQMPVWLRKHSLQLVDMTPDFCANAATLLYSRPNAKGTERVPYSPNTVARYRTNARALFSAAVDRGYLPAEGGTGWATIDSAAKDAGSLYTGEDEEFGPPKTESRKVPLPPPLVEILRAYIGDRTSGLIYSTRTDGMVSATNLERTWRRARGVKTWRIYDLRHACATQWLRSGVDIAVVAEYMGHSPEVLIGTYAGVIGGAHERSIDLIEGIFATPSQEGTK